jgi:transposase-like protein
VLDPDEWKIEVVAAGMTLCPVCRSTNLTMGACAVGSITVHQEYVCEDCQYEFNALFGLLQGPAAE